MNNDLKDIQKWRQLVEEIDDQNVVSQASILKMVKGAKKESFIKNTVVAIIKTSNLTDEQKQQVGSIDKTKYSKEYLKKNPYVLIQAKKDGTVDMYNPDQSVIQNNYKQAKPNKQILDALDKAGIDQKTITMFGVKTAPVMMARSATLGVEGKKIESPWGDTQDALEGSYIVDGGNEAYVVNPDNNGMPIGYIKK